MRLRSMQLENFRQFYGNNEVAFAQDPDHNVTVIYGANGAGKTALLNAFTWAFYGEFSPDFENPEMLINKRAWAETSIGETSDARVSVEFEHEESVYQIARVTTERKSEGGSSVTVRDSVPSALRVDPDGRQSEIGNPGELASQILPYRLFSFFFFNGERIEKLVSSNAYAQIEDGIKTLLGLSIVERAIGHTDTALKELRKAQQKVGSPQTQTLIDELRGDEENRDLKSQEHDDLVDKIAKENQVLAAIEKRLRTKEATKQIQQNRDECEAALQSARDSIDDTRAKISEAIGVRGYLAFTGGLADECLKTVAELHEKGELPAPLKRQFVDELLDRHICICDRSLDEGEPPYTAVSAWRNRAGAGAEMAWGQLSAHAKHVIEERPTFYGDLRERMDRVFQLGTTEKKLLEKLSELHQQLDSKESEEIKDLEARRQKVKLSRDSLTMSLGGVNQEIKTLDERVKLKEKQLSDAMEKGEEAKLAQHRVEVATVARDLFKEILALRTDEVRSSLDERIRRIYSGISFKPSVPRLSPEFHLELLESLDGPRVPAKSTGENLILSLSFVGALAEFARLRHEEAAQKGASTGAGLQYRGGIYPLVTDSPFGNLDDNYCTDIARVIPKLAPQVIVMVSKRQGLGPVENELGPRIGARDVLVYHTPKEGEVDEAINLLGHDHSYIVSTDEDWEWAEIRSLD